MIHLLKRNKVVRPESLPSLESSEQGLNLFLIAEIERDHFETLLGSLTLDHGPGGVKLMEWYEFVVVLPVLRSIGWTH